FRAAFVLCVLDGKSGAEAAAELGIREGTVSSRLTRARQRLQQRLTRRGIKLAGLLAALSVAESVCRASVTTPLAHATIRSALLVAAGGTLAGVIPSRVAALAAGVTRAMFLTKAKIATAVVLAAGVLAAGGLLTRQALGGRPNASQTTEEKKGDQISKPLSDENRPAEAITVKGRVLDPNDKPVFG